MQLSLNPKMPSESTEQLFTEFYFLELPFHYVY